MAINGMDFARGAMMGLAACNLMQEVGATDSTVSGNATIALLRTAIEALPPSIGAGPNAKTQISRGLQFALNAGAVSSTHGASTIAGLASTIQAAIVAAGVQCDSTLDTYLPQ